MWSEEKEELFDEIYYKHQDQCVSPMARNRIQDTYVDDDGVVHAFFEPVEGIDPETGDLFPVEDVMERFGLALTEAGFEIVNDGGGRYN